MAAEHVRRNCRSPKQQRSLTTRSGTRQSQRPIRSRSNQVAQEVAQENQQDIPQETTEKHPDNMFKVITYPKQVSEQAGDYGQLHCNQLHRERKKTKNTKITIDESAENAEKVKTTINNIVMHYHDDVTHPDEVHQDCFIRTNGSEMKHIQKDYEVKTSIHREFSANQNFAIAGEKNDEDHAVPSVMKLTEKLTDVMVDEMILETDVDETHCLPQLADVSVPQLAEGIVEVVTAFHGSESQNESLHTSSTCQNTHKHTQSDGEYQRFSISRSKF